jgi:asparagine synthase (glutamine-hydrolysing)
MCGLTGLWQPRGAGAQELCALAEKMSQTIVHRGPDDSGTWCDAGSGVAFGFRRLAILDLSPAGHQPMSSHDGRYATIFNGEIYNYLEIRKQLQGLGVTFTGHSDTEVMLEAASMWGAEATIRRIGGMFALALWDRVERRLLLARDRLGKKPMYYTVADGTLLFGSELKTLRAHPAFRGGVDRDALASYLRYGYVPAPRSIYENVFKLPPGSYAVIREDLRPEVHVYWDGRAIAEEGLRSPLELSDAEATEQLDALLRVAVSQRMLSDVPLGALLSGGIDSSTVVALMQAQSSRPVKTFTIGFDVAAYDEAKAAKDVAAHLGTEHTEFYVTPDEAREVIPRLPDLYDEPFADSSQIPTFLVCELARRHVTVALSGDGGDELFSGYTRYLWAERIWHKLRLMPGPVRWGISRALRGVPARHWDSLYGGAERFIPRHHRQTLPGDKLHKLADLLAAGSPDALYKRLVSQWKQPEELVIGGRELTTFVDRMGEVEGASFTERMMLADMLTYLPDDILTKVDRASMGVSLEGRAPLLDHNVAEWSWRVPLQQKRRDGQGKWLLRQVLYRYVPQAMVERPKMGFGVPIDSWLRGPLRDWAEALLDENRLRREGFLRPEPIRRAWHQHLSGERNDQYRLWTILMFQAWHERWLG